MTEQPRADDESALATPLQRLQASRERMRTYLLPAARKPRSDDDDDDGGFIGHLGDKLGEWRHHPLVGAVIDAVEGWWVNHPLRSVADIGSTAARELAGPVLRRHPVASVAAALVVGALLVRIKPWRWVLRPALFAGLTTHVVTRLLSDAPLEFLLSSLTKFRPQPRPEATAAPTDSDPDIPPAEAAPIPSAAPTRERVTDPATEPAVPP